MVPLTNQVNLIFFFFKCQTENVHFVHTFIDFIYFLFILQEVNGHD